MQSNISSWTMINKLNYYYSFNWSAKPLVYFVNFDVNAFNSLRGAHLLARGFRANRLYFYEVAVTCVLKLN